MPIILLLVFIGIIIVVGIVVWPMIFADLELKAIPYFLLYVIIIVALITWPGIVSQSIRKYVLITEAKTENFEINNQIFTRITYVDWYNIKKTREIGCIKPDTKVIIKIPQRMYFGILFEENALPDEIEVVNNDVEIQSSKYETSQTIESQRATGLLQ